MSRTSEAREVFTDNWGRLNLTLTSFILCKSIKKNTFGKLSEGGSDKNPMLNAPSIDFNHEVSEELFRNGLELNFRDFRLVFDVRLFDIVLNIILNVNR